MNQDDSTITTAVSASSDLHLATELARVKYENAQEIEALAHELFIKARENFKRRQQICDERHKEYSDALRAELAAKK